MERDQFTFYRSFWEALKELPKKDQLPFVMAVCAYAFGEESNALTGAASASFLLVKPILDKANRKAANGKQGGSKPKANRKQTESKKEGEKEIEGEVEVEIENECSPPSSPPLGGGTPSRFVPPAEEEVAAYCRERKNGVDARQFVDFYAAKGWMIGKNKMKDWQAAVRTWEAKDGRTAKPVAEAENTRDWGLHYD